MCWLFNTNLDIWFNTIFFCFWCFFGSSFPIHYQHGSYNIFHTTKNTRTPIPHIISYTPHHRMEMNNFWTTHHPTTLGRHSNHRFFKFMTTTASLDEMQQLHHHGVMISRSESILRRAQPLCWFFEHSHNHSQHQAEMLPKSSHPFSSTLPSKSSTVHWAPIQRARRSRAVPPIKGRIAIGKFF